ncbi:YciI family protein [Phenylobacterium sp. VNQ135]|uniref:YciI family protein n=1 Tax=Phenylobacterium sp. VNQ135 TaxID=3400922 RepID=UPI003C11A261
MKYMLLIYDPAEAYEGEAGLKLLERVVAEHMALATELRRSGVMSDGAGLQPPETAMTVVRGGDGRHAVLDGPYTETKEHLGGYYVVEAADLEAALAIARRIPGAPGSKVEVRPVMTGD